MLKLSWKGLFHLNVSPRRHSDELILKVESVELEKKYEVMDIAWGLAIHNRERPAAKLRHFKNQQKNPGCRKFF
jgi:hypothetical protein